MKTKIFEFSAATWKDGQPHCIIVMAHRQRPPWPGTIGPHEGFLGASEEGIPGIVQVWRDIGGGGYALANVGIEIDGDNNIILKKSMIQSAFSGYVAITKGFIHAHRP